MIKYYKTPDVISTDTEGNAYCTNGVIVLDTARMDEESNRAALRLVNALRFIKCSKIESENREVITPMGVIEYAVVKVIDCPARVREVRLGIFEIDGVRQINTTADSMVLGQDLYCE